MAIETLELGHMLVRERPSLATMASSLSRTPEDADRAVRHALRTAWLTRSTIQTRGELIDQLYGRLRIELRRPR